MFFKWEDCGCREKYPIYRLRGIFCLFICFSHVLAFGPCSLCVWDLFHLLPLGPPVLEPNFDLLWGDTQVTVTTIRIFPHQFLLTCRYFSSPRYWCTSCPRRTSRARISASRWMMSSASLSWSRGCPPGQSWGRGWEESPRRGCQLWNVWWTVLLLLLLLLLLLHPSAASITYNTPTY